MLPPLQPSPLTWCFVALASCSAAVALGLTVAQARGRDVPLAAWLVGPTILATIATVASVVQLRLALAGIPTASPELRAAVAGAGLSTGATTWALGWEWTFFALLATTWIAALSTLVAPSAARWRWIPPVSTLGAVVCAAALQGAATALLGEALLPSIATLVAGLPLAVILARRDQEGDAAPARIAVVFLSVVTAVAATFLVFAAGLGQTAAAWAKASAETRHAWQTNQIALGHSHVWLMATSGLVVGAIGWIARATWIRRTTGPPAARGVAFAIGLAAVPAVGTLAGWGPARALWAITGDTFAYPASDTLRFPTVDRVQDTRNRPPEVLIDRRSVVIGGEWVCDLDRTDGPALPAGARARLTAAIRALPPGEPMLLQADSELPWEVVGPVLDALHQAGRQRVEIVAVGSDRVGVVALSLPHEPAPSAQSTTESVLRGAAGSVRARQ